MSSRLFSNIVNTKKLIAFAMLIFITLAAGQMVLAQGPADGCADAWVYASSGFIDDIDCVVGCYIYAV